MIFVTTYEAENVIIIEISCNRYNNYKFFYKYIIYINYLYIY